MAEESMDFGIDKQNLYREEYFTDLKVASIRRLTPVKVDGTEDKGRKTLYIGQANLMSEAGPLPISTVIDASDLKQAVKKYPEAMQDAMLKLNDEIRRYQQEQQSQIVAPGREESRIILPGR